jgi:hypothetical protein
MWRVGTFEQGFHPAKETRCFRALRPGAHYALQTTGRRHKRSVGEYSMPPNTSQII